MRIKNYIYIPIIASLSITSCNKSGSANPIPVKTIPPTHTGPDVYVAGYLTAGNGHHVAAYWRNDTLTTLSDSTLMSEASSIIVKGSDVYVAGISSSKDQGNTTITYWKNGVISRLSTIANLGGSQSSFAINGNDLYMAGNINLSNEQRAAYWKNGIVNILPDSASGSFAYGICTNGPDIYSAGYLDALGGIPTAVYWKNSVLSVLGNGAKYASIAYSIKTNNSDVYAAGYTQAISNVGSGAYATFWKNGAPTQLTQIPVSSFAYDLALSDTDVYVAGYVLSGVNKPAFWKNGVQTLLDVTNAGNYDGHLTASIAVNGTDVYMVAGYPRYWKNGTAVQLTKNGGALGIFIVPN